MRVLKNLMRKVKYITMNYKSVIPLLFTFTLIINVQLFGGNSSDLSSDDCLSSSNHPKELEKIRIYIEPFVNKIQPFEVDIHLKSNADKIKFFKTFGFSSKITEQEKNNIYKIVNKGCNISISEFTILCCQNKKFYFSWTESKYDIFYLFKIKNDNEWYVWKRINISYDKF